MIPNLVTSPMDGLTEPKVEPILGMNISWQVSQDRYCPGYVNLKSSLHIKCKNNGVLDAIKGERCVLCERLSGFKKGFLFRDYSSEESRYYFTQRHVLYVAIHGIDLVKIGTANILRKYDRLYEQGATAATIVGEGTFNEIMFLEDFISRTLSIAQHRRRTNDIPTVSPKQLQDAISQMRENVAKVASLLQKAGYSKHLVKLPEELVLLQPSSDSRSVALCLRQYIAKPRIIVGKIKQVFGDLLLVKRGEEEFVYNKRSIIGRIVSKASSASLPTYDQEHQYRICS